MALFQNAILNKYLAGIEEERVFPYFSEEAEWMAYFNEQKAQADELKSQIEQTDKEIDGMVYELYGLTGEEIGVVGGGL